MESIVSTFGYILSLALFAAFATCTALRLRLSVNQPRLHLPSDLSNKKILLYCTILVLLTRIILYVYATVVLKQDIADNFLDRLLQSYNSGDSQQYLKIAENWYPREGDDKVILVFYPMMPLLIKGLSLLIPNQILCGYLISNAALIFASYFLFKLALMDFDTGTARRSVLLLTIFPVTFFFASAMTEGIFLLFAVGGIYAARTKRYLLAGMCCMFASFTKLLGVLIAIPCFVEYLLEIYPQFKKDAKGAWMELLKKSLPLLLSAVGILAYLLINADISGNPFQFLIYQKEHWSQEMQFFPKTIKTILDYALNSDDVTLLLTLWLPQVLSIFATLVLMLFSIKRLRLSYLVFMLFYFFFAISPSWLLSAPRYLMCMFPLFFTMGDITRKKVNLYVYCILFILLLFPLAYAFANRYQIY